jgi:hypothetical protein
MGRKKAMKRRIAGLLLLGIFVSAGAVVLPAIPSITDPRPVCLRADEWVREHASSLPKTLDGLAELPKTYRVRVYNVMTPEERASVWREQLAGALDRRDLTSEQRRFIQEVLPQMTADLFGPQKPVSLLKSIEQRAKALFVSHEQADIMIQIGPDKPTKTGVGSIALLVALNRWYKSGFTLSASAAMAPPDCTCPTPNLDCWSHCAYSYQGTSCKSCESSPCKELTEGCGFWGGCHCNGLCCSSDCGSCIDETGGGGGLVVMPIVMRTFLRAIGG